MSEKCQEETHAPQQLHALFDHLVGARKQRRGDFEAKRFGRLEVDDQLKSGRLFDGQIGGARSLQDLLHIIARPAKEFVHRRAITDEAAGFSDQRARGKQRKPMHPCLRSDAIPQVTNSRITDHLERVRVLCHECCKQGIKIVTRFECNGHHLNSDGIRLYPEVFQNDRVGRVERIEHNTENARLRNNLAQEFKQLANVHLDAVEHKDRIVFLHSVEDGPANQSYGLQVAQLAGVPAGVIRAAKKHLHELEQDGAARGRQPDLFAAPVAPEAAPAIDPELVATLRALDPDALTPKQALETLYALKKLLQD